MIAKMRTLEVDEATAAALESSAADRGLSVSELLDGLTSLQSASVALSSQDLDDLDRQWAAIKAGEPTVPHEDVARWLQTWGTSAFRPWHSR